MCTQMKILLKLFNYIFYIFKKKNIITFFVRVPRRHWILALVAQKVLKSAGLKRYKHL